MKYALIASMDKIKAIELLGGSVSEAAKAIGVSYQAVRNWPEKLPNRIEDRVLAALVRSGRFVSAPKQAQAVAA